MNHRYTAEQFALQLGYPNVQAFRYAMQDGHVPPPDGVFAKAPYWNQDTVEKTKTAHYNAIVQGFSRAAPQSDAGKPKSE